MILFIALLTLVTGIVQGTRLSARDTTTTHPITVTATRMPTSVSNTGRSLFVITRDQIRAMPVSSIDEVLRYVPGLETQQRGPFGTQTDFIMRGSTFSQVLVLVDGMRINDPLTGHYNSYIPVALPEIVRIEVLRGPASALWGPDAVGGVVNIITRAFGYGSETDTVTDAAIELGGGDNGLLSINAGGAAGNGHTLFSGGVCGYSSTGYPRIQQPPADFTLFTGSVSARHDLGNGSNFAIRAGGDSKDFDARYYYTRSASDQSRETVQTLWAQAMVQHHTEHGTIRLDVAYKRLRDQFNFNPTFPSINQHVTEYANAMLTSHLAVTDAITLGYGIQADNRSIISSDRGNHRTFHAGAFTTASVLLHNVIINGSARADYDRNYGWQFTPQVSAAYTLGIASLRGAAGRSVRAADYTERYVSTNLPGPLSPGRNLGNPNLAAETNWSWEFGADLAVSKELMTSVTAFSRNGQNQIDYALTNSNDIPNNATLVADTMYFYAQNIASVKTTGIEMQATGTLGIAENCVLRYVLGYTILDIESAGTNTKYLTTTARQLGTTQLGVDWGNMSLAANTIYKVRNADNAPGIEARLSPSYLVGNVSLRYRFFRQLGAYVQVNNVGDLHYTDVLGAQMPGRWISAGLFTRF